MPDSSKIESKIIKYRKLRGIQARDEYLEWKVGHHCQIAQIVEDLSEEGDLILDDGCGNRPHWVGIRNREMVGVDLDRSWIDRTKRIPIEGHFLLADGCRLSFVDKGFSLVISVNVLEHVQKERRKMYLDEMKRVAKKYYLSCPHSLSFIYSVLRGRLGSSLSNKEHLFWRLPSPTFLHEYFDEQEFLYTENPKYKKLISILRALGILRFLYPYKRIIGSTADS